MRTPRIFILALFSAAFFFLLCRAITSAASPSLPASTQPSQKSTFRSFFSFTAPFSLFPPNAIITIADDNSTSFAARPAAFGPPLPAKGLNGQLWVGSGFSEETIVDGEGEGELGCSDVAGWNDRSSISALKPLLKHTQSKSASKPVSPASKKWRRDNQKDTVADRSAIFESDSKSKEKLIDDGTDDYLHQRLGLSQRLANDASGSISSSHADIQSIQEGAEITGKIVLLSRGGCGFLEKVKWAQRRGATGLIVGDNQRGGPLIQMYAHGDTSNVSIPSIFTSRTTAYLLSLMMQPGSFMEDIIDDNGKPVQKVQQYDRSIGNRKAASASPSTQKDKLSRAPRRESIAQLRETRPELRAAKAGWFSRLFGTLFPSKTSAELTASRYGRSDWVLVEDFPDEKDKGIRNSLDQVSRNKGGGGMKSNTRRPPQDDFQIGVEDWRDPDLVGTDKSESTTEDNNRSSKTQTKPGQVHYANKHEPNEQGHTGRTPSGTDYAASHSSPKDKDATGLNKGKSSMSGGDGFISKLFGEGEDKEVVFEEQGSSSDTSVIDKASSARGPPPPSEREGLWVVITPTSGATPFFDTLLVLVISPLITLTVVYALLILRARIRRRRWRAPKSVVERLPVRTYHTVTSTPSRSPRLPSPTSTSPTMPLLQGQSSQHGPSRSRPRSRTTTGVPSAGDLLDVNAALSVAAAPRAEEKRAGSSQWKKYMGRQIECVVCLEEYVDGVSQVMSLPCGHEFHVDCITPWLTTRRRTCPICKGDVVRSLARGSSSSPRYDSYQDDTDEEESSAQDSSPSTSNSRLNDSPDLEQGLPTVPHVSRQPGWLNLLSSSIRDRFVAHQERTGDIESRNR
ncbi:hypothetical protein GGS21DRAFT_431087 [Xylaria nigripes]|nr:hypothetical protein GGS21DRAFT_431087 [Xylaria nigripes]